MCNRLKSLSCNILTSLFQEKLLVVGFNNFIANFEKRDLRKFIALTSYDLIDYFMPSL